MAFSCLPFSLILFSRLYGFDRQLGATALVISFGVATALAPLAVWLARHI